MTDDKKFRERRQYERYPLLLEAKISLGGENLETTVFDVSAGGAKIRLEDDPFKRVVLNIPPFGEFEGEIVWKDEEYIGIKFHEDHKKMMEVILEMTDHSRDR